MWRKVLALVLLTTLLSSTSVDAFLLKGQRLYSLPKDDDGFYIDILGHFRGSWNSMRLEDILVRETYHRHLRGQMNDLVSHLYSEVMSVMDQTRDDPANSSLRLGGRYDLQVAETSFMGPGMVHGISDNFSDTSGVLYYQVSLDLRNYPPEVREEILILMEQSKEKIESVPLYTRGGASLGAGEVFQDVTRDRRTGEILFINHIVYYAVPLSVLEDEARQEEERRGGGDSKKNETYSGRTSVEVSSCSQLGSRQAWERYINNLTEAQGFTLTDLERRMLDDCGDESSKQDDHFEFSIEHPGFGCVGVACTQHLEIRGQIQQVRETITGTNPMIPTSGVTGPTTDETPSLVATDGQSTPPALLNVDDVYRQNPCLFNPRLCGQPPTTPNGTPAPEDEELLLEPKSFYTHILE